MAGSGELADQSAFCGSGEEGCSSDDDTDDYDEASQYGCALDLLFHVGPQSRLGFGFLLLPSSKVEVGSSKIKLGVEADPVLVAEAVFGAKTAGTVRAFGGASVLFPASDLKDVSEELNDRCQAFESLFGGSCSVDTGPYVGFTLGVGGGVLSELNDGMAVRADLTLQYVDQDGPSLTASGDGVTDERASSLSGTRVWFTGGLEF